MSDRMIPARDKNWFGHPRGLSVLFLTEMWEMFSFFGMRALLVYYMTKHLDLGQEYASLVYGAYAAFVYFTPVFGGMVADRWLGKRNAVMIGGTTGWLVPPGDAPALTRAIRELVGDPAGAAAMAAAGRARVDAQFNAIGQAEQLAALFGARRSAVGVGAR